MKREAVSEKVSAVIITKNESRVIDRCVKALAWMDEILVYDTGSTDDTVAVAERAGARVVKGEPMNPFHFAEARNRATALAAGPWILSMDADEVLRSGGLSKIRKALEAPENVTAFRLGFINRAAAGTVSIPIMKIKLFLKDAWTWKYRIHERLIATREGAIGDLPKAVIDHMPEPDKAARHGQNIGLLELAIKENPEYVKAYKHLGLELMLAKRFGEATENLEHYIDNTDDDRLKKSRAMDHCGNCLVADGRLPAAMEMFERSAKIAPERRDPCYHAAIALIKACNLDEAIRWIRRMMLVPIETRPASPYDLPGLWRDEPAKMLRFCEEQIAEAKKLYEARKSS